MIDTSLLNAFSLQVYEYLQRHYPAYLKIITTKPCDIFDGHFLTFEIEAPNPNVDGNLILDTEDNQITVYFHHFHCHYAGFQDLRIEDEIMRAFQCVQYIIEQEYLLVSYYKNNQLSLSGLRDKEILEENAFKKDPYAMKYDRAEILSWTGVFDKSHLLR